MALRLIRQGSDTPNITNHDDARMARYAYGGYNGYIKGVGDEIGHETNGANFIVKSGVIVLQGWEVEIDANGVTIAASASVAEKEYYSVYLEVNCATDSAEIKSSTGRTGFPEVASGDDLTANTIGTARLLLYHFTATSGAIADVEKMVQGISYMDEIIAEMDQRLDEMGFKEASIENGEIALQSGWSDAESPSCIVQKLGKFAILKNLDLGTKTNIEVNNDKGDLTNRYVCVSEIHDPVVIILPEEFRPKNPVWANALIGLGDIRTPGIAAILYIKPNGEVTIEKKADSYEYMELIWSTSELKIVRVQNIGWELP